MVRTVIVLVVSSIYMVFEGAVFIPLGFLFKKPAWIYWSGIRVAKLATWLTGAQITVEGREHLNPGRPAVFVCNHASNLDPPAIATVLPRVVIMAKKEAFRIPIAGTAFRMVGFIPVDRGTERAAASVVAGTERLKEGLSMLAFPEGTRGNGLEMLPFRHGVFLMAIRANALIVPITLTGLREMMPRGSFATIPGPVRFVAHRPISTDGLTEKDRGELADQVRAIIASAL